ncbi:hypothetical protein LH464_17435 [Neorhizobium sp. T786]|uniref:hypothetical protein n=1 Tax=Pseudorhizobium xiangyangii TaxID=2883104 RepID=UPI001CFFB6E7|nr:hypothetical protein [Neorhizobium xiangyangii]MCB5204252.1 hypothetical protein [Neorhizobium xiangyangii]
MIEPRAMDELLARDPLAPVQSAIVATLKPLLPGVSIEKHPGKVDLSELVAKTVVLAPGIGIGFSRVRETFLTDGATCFAVEWVAYIVAEAKVVATRRREKEEVGLAIGARLLAILADPTISLWGLHGTMPIEDKPSPEMKPFFTIKDAKQGTAYYAVTWTQVVADISSAVFPEATGAVSEDATHIQYEDEALTSIEPWIPVEVSDD